MRAIADAFGELATNPNRSTHVRAWITDEGGNLLPENVATGTDTSSNTTGFTARASATLVSTTSEAWEQSRALEVQGTATGDGFSTNAVAAEDSQTYAGSVYLRSQSGVKEVRVWVRDVANATDGTFVDVKIRDDMWTRVGATHTVGLSATVSLVVESRDGSFNFYADGLKLEQGTAPSKWTEKATEWLVNLADYLDENWIREASWSHASREIAGAARLVLQRAVRGDDLSMSPRRGDSLVNFDDTGASSPLLRMAKLMWFEVQIGPEGEPSDPDGTWVEVFRGRIDKISLGSSRRPVITLELRDLAGQGLVDYWSREERPQAGAAPSGWYEDLTWPDAIEDVTQAVLDGVIGQNIAPTLYVSGVIGWSKNEPLPDNPLVKIEPLGPFLQNLAHSLGHEIRFVWNDGAEEWRLTWIVPDRTTIAADETFARSFYRIEKWESEIENIRTAIGAVYTDETDGYERKRLEARNSESYVLFGDRYGLASEDSIGPVDTTSEAQDFLDNLLDDFSVPGDLVTLSVPLYPWVELGDRIGAGGPNQFDEDTLVGVVQALEHTVGNGAGRTTITMLEVDTVNAVAAIFHRRRARQQGAFAFPGVARVPSFVQALQAVRTSVYRSAAQVITSGSDTTVQFDTKDDDRQGNFDTTSHEFTAPYDGIYIVSSVLLFSAGAAGEKYSARILRNGSTEVAGSEQTSTKLGSIAVSVSAGVTLTAGQRLTVEVNQDSGSNKSLTGGKGASTLTVTRIR